MKPLERELATMRGFAAIRRDDDCLDEADAELAQLRNIEEAASRQCRWAQDADDGSWNTDCGGKFCIEEGTPKENDMLFCCYCGAGLVTPNDEAKLRLPMKGQKTETPSSSRQLERLVMPGLKDVKLSSGRWRGEVIDLCKPPKERRVCYVYGDTLKGMRKIKHAIVELLRA